MAKRERTDHHNRYLMVEPTKSSIICTADDYETTVEFNEQTLEVSSAVVVKRDRPPRPDRGKAKDETASVDLTDQWELAGSFVSAVLNPSLVLSFLAAIGSKLWEGAAADDVIQFRWQCCSGQLDGVQIMPPCEGLRYDKEGSAYCAYCGCGKYKKAKLNPQRDGKWTTSKLAYPLLHCPLNRFYPVRGRKAVDVTYKGAPVIS